MPELKLESVENIAQFVKDFNFCFLVPPFSNPDEIPDDTLLEIVIIWQKLFFLRVDRTIFTAAEVEVAAKAIFGPDLKDMEHQELGLVWWDAALGEYEVRACQLGSWVETYIINTETAKDHFLIDVVHLKVVCDFSDEATSHETYDDNGHLLGKYTVDEVENIAQATLLKLPRRRYIFTVCADGSVNLAQSLKLQ